MWDLQMSEYKGGMKEWKMKETFFDNLSETSELKDKYDLNFNKETIIINNKLYIHNIDTDELYDNDELIGILDGINIKFHSKLDKNKHEKNYKKDLNDLSGDEDDLSGDEDDLTGDEDDLTGDEDDLTGDEDDLSGDEDDLSGDEDDLSGEEDGLSGDEDDLSGSSSSRWFIIR